MVRLNIMTGVLKEVNSTERQNKNPRTINNEISSGNVTEESKGVLTSSMTVFCSLPETSGYIIIVPASVLNSTLVNEVDRTYINICAHNPMMTLTTTPESLYNESNTVLLTGLTEEFDSLGRLDRSMLIVKSNAEVEVLNWVEWSISCNIVHIERLLIESEGGNINNAVSRTNIIFNMALIKAWSTGAVDEAFKYANSNIIATSMVGSERDTFSKAIDYTHNDTSDRANRDSNVTTVDSNENAGNFLFSSLQITGFVMFISLFASFAILITLASKKRRREETEKLAWVSRIESGSVLESDLSVDYSENNDYIWEKASFFSRCWV